MQEMWDKVLWVKFGWSEYYRGGAVDGNFKFLDGNQGHEAYNFQPAGDGTYYCYVPPHSGRYAPGHKCSELSGWTVVCLAKHPEYPGIHIVGWYEDTTLLRGLKDVPETSGRLPVSSQNPDARWRYCLSSKRAFFVPPERRVPPFAHRSIRQAKYSFLCGPGVKVTKNKKEVFAILRNRMRKLDATVIPSPSEASAPDSGADSTDPLRGLFGTPEHRKKVEKAAEEAVKKYYDKKEFQFTNVTKLNLGFDFIFRKGETEYHVEVKGTAGDRPRFFLTRNENACRKDDPLWRFAIVTNALGPKPTLCVYNNQAFENAFELKPYVFLGGRPRGHDQ